MKDKSRPVTCALVLSASLLMQQAVAVVLLKKFRMYMLGAALISAATRCKEGNKLQNTVIHYKEYCVKSDAGAGSSTKKYWNAILPEEFTMVDM